MTSIDSRARGLMGRLDGALLASSIGGLIAGTLAGILLGERWTLAIGMTIGVMLFVGLVGFALAGSRHERFVRGALFDGVWHRFMALALIPVAIGLASLAAIPRGNESESISDEFEQARTLAADKIERANQIFTELDQKVALSLELVDRPEARHFASRTVFGKNLNRAKFLAELDSDFHTAVSDFQKERPKLRSSASFEAMSQHIPNNANDVIQSMSADLDKLADLLEDPGGQRDLITTALSEQNTELLNVSAKFTQLAADALKKELPLHLTILNYQKEIRVFVVEVGAEIRTHSEKHAAAMEDRDGFKELSNEKKQEVIQKQQAAIDAYSAYESQASVALSQKLTEANTKYTEWKREIAAADDPARQISIDTDRFLQLYTEAGLVIVNARHIATLAQQQDDATLYDSIKTAHESWQKHLDDSHKNWLETLEKFRSEGETSSDLKTVIEKTAPDALEGTIASWRLTIAEWQSSLPPPGTETWDDWDDVPDVAKLHPGVWIAKAMGWFKSREVQTAATQTYEELSRDQVPSASTVEAMLARAPTPAERRAMLDYLRAQAKELREKENTTLSESTYEAYLDLLDSFNDKIMEDLASLSPTARSVYRALEEDRTLTTQQLKQVFGADVTIKDKQVRVFESKTEKLGVEQALSLIGRDMRRKHWVEGGLQDVPTIDEVREGSTP